MSKKYIGKLCVYCQERPSIRQGDHVFAREFFLEAERNNLIKVPACDFCNNEKSILEHYLISVLPFGGLHNDSKEHLSNFVSPRLEKNQKLKRELRNGMKDILETDENGKETKNLTLPFSGERYAELFKYITKALAWHYWEVFLVKNCFVYSIALTTTGSEAFEKYFFSLRSKNIVENIIGERTVIYKGVQAFDNDKLTIWEFKMYNGLVATNSLDEGFHKSMSVGVISGDLSQEHKIIELFESERT